MISGEVVLVMLTLGMFRQVQPTWHPIKTDLLMPYTCVYAYINMLSEKSTVISTQNTAINNHPNIVISYKSTEQ